MIDRINLRTLPATLLLLFLVLLTGAAMAVQPERPQWMDGEIIVKFKDGVSKADVTSLLSKRNLQVLHRYRLLNANHVKLPAGLGINAVMRILKRSPLVEYAQPNNLYYKSQIPNDTLFTDMWGANNTGQTGGTFDADMDLPEAWDITTGSSDVVVAVLDSGADLTHPDLVNNLWHNPGEIAGNGIDDDNNGYIDDIVGWDFVRNDNDPSPVGGSCGGHGTHTAGTIGASGNNNLGTTGVGWNVKVMPLNTFRTFLAIFCTTSDADLLEAIDYYTSMGVRISSNSYGGGAYSQVMSDMIRSSKSVFVAAAGNESNNNDISPSYPANYNVDGIISVAASDHNDMLASFSNFGNSVDVAAPGVDIVSTVPGGYASFSGTSMATPNVAGVVALLLSQDPGLTVNEMKWRILHGTDFHSLNVATQGRVNAFNSLQFGLSLPAVSASVSPVGSTTVPAGASVDYSVSVTNNTASDQITDARVYGRDSIGRELVVAGPVTLNVPAGATLTYNLSQVIPAGLSPQQVDLIASAETASSLDEDITVYTVTQ